MLFLIQHTSTATHAMAVNIKSNRAPMTIGKGLDSISKTPAPGKADVTVDNVGVRLPVRSPTRDGAVSCVTLLSKP